MPKARFASANLMVVPLSQNRKIGYAASTYRPIGQTGTGTCPSNCGIKKLCYAKTGLVRFAEIRSAGAHGDLEDIARSSRSLVRHHVSGDCFTEDQLDRQYVTTLLAFHKFHRTITGWLYTHHIKAWDDAGFTSDTIPANLTVIASCDSDQGVEYATLHGWQYARITLSTNLPDGKLRANEIYCPYDRAKDFGQSVDEIRVTCSKCRLCFEKNYNIVFTTQFPGREWQRDTQRKKAMALLDTSLGG